MSENNMNDVEEIREPDPEPLSIILEIINLAIQPGTLAAIAGVTGIAGSLGSAAQGIIAYQEISERKRAEIRRALFEIERALIKGASGLNTLTSLLMEFSFTDNQQRIGNAPIQGFKNSETLRRVHEDCRAAVKEARDAFINLSSQLPAGHEDTIRRTLNQLNELAEQFLRVGQSYARSIVAIASALTSVDNLITDLGKRYGFIRDPRDYKEELIRAYPQLGR